MISFQRVHIISEAVTWNFCNPDLTTNDATSFHRAKKNIYDIYTVYESKI